MIRAGKLEHLIAVERVSAVTGASGIVTETWTPIATRLAEIVDAATEEHVRGERGVSTESKIAFRLYYVEGVTPADRVVFDGQAFDIKVIKEIGRRQGLELTCEGRGL